MKDLVGVGSIESMDHNNIANMLLSEMSAPKVNRVPSAAATAAATTLIVTSACAITANTIDSLDLTSQNVPSATVPQRFPTASMEGADNNKLPAKDAPGESVAVKNNAPPSEAKGGSGFYRRKKIVPSVVAKKMANSKPARSTGSAGSPSNRTAVVTTVEPNVDAKMANIDPVQEPPSQRIEANETSACSTESGSLTATKPEEKEPKRETKNVAPGSAVPGSAFRRIKPKVVILASQKPAKSILKKSSAPVTKVELEKENNSTVGNEAQGEAECGRLTDHLKPLDKDVSEGNHPQSLPVDEENVKPTAERDQQVDVDQFASKRTNDTIVMDRSVQEEGSRSKDEYKSRYVAQKSTSFVGGQMENEPLPVSKSSLLLEGIKDPVPPCASRAPSETSNRTAPEAERVDGPVLNTVPTPNPVGPAKTIRRVRQLPPELAERLKNSIGKGMPTFKRTKVKTAEEKPLASASPASETVIEPQTRNGSITRTNVPSDPIILITVPPATKDPCDSVQSESSVRLQTGIQTDSSAEAVTASRPPDIQPDALQQPSATRTTMEERKPTDTGEAAGSGSRKIQKIHQLTAEQQKLLLKSLMKGKAKPLARNSKVPSVSSSIEMQADKITPSVGFESNRTVVETVRPPLKASEVPSIESHMEAPIVQTIDTVDNAASSVQYEPAVAPAEPVMAPSTHPPVPSGSPQRNSHKIQIISQYVLPPIIVSASKSTGKSPSFSSFNSPVNHPIASTSLLTNPLEQPFTAVENSMQYPKLFVLHRPNPAVVQQTVLPTVGVSPPNDLKPVQTQPAVSVTVLPKSTSMVPTSPSFGAFEPKANPLSPSFMTITSTPVEFQSMLPTTPTRQSHHVSFIATPRSNTSSNERIIVPKIVIERCSGDQDSQSSSSSTSSSSLPSSVQKENPRMEKIVAKKGLGCSPHTRDRLRAKALMNLNSRGQSPDVNVDRLSVHRSSILRCYKARPSSKTKGIILQKFDSRIGMEETIIQNNNPEYYPDTEAIKDTTEKEQLNSDIVDDINSLSIVEEIEDTTEKEKSSSNLDNIKASTEPSSEDLGVSSSNPGGKPVKNISTAEKPVYIPEDQAEDTTEAQEAEEDAEVVVEEEQHSQDTVDFHGFSNSSIDVAQRDLADRTRAFDLVLDMENDPVETVNVPDVVEENSMPSQISPKANDATTTELTTSHPTNVIEACVEGTAEALPSTEHEEAKEENIHPGQNDVDSEPREDDWHSNSTEEEDVQEVQIEERTAELDRELPAVDTNDQNLPSTSDPNSKEYEVNVATETSQALPHLQEDDDMTGVDLIIAMANLRRDSRVQSIDDGASAWMNQTPSVTFAMDSSGPPQSVSVERSDRRKKKRKRYKRNRKEFVQLLLKHVDYEALRKDLLEQIKRRYDCGSSSPEEDGFPEEQQQDLLDEVVHVEEGDFELARSLAEEILRPFQGKDVSKPADVSTTSCNDEKEDDAMSSKADKPCLSQPPGEQMESNSCSDNGEHLGLDDNTSPFPEDGENNSERSDACDTNTTEDIKGRRTTPHVDGCTNSPVAAVPAESTVEHVPLCDKPNPVEVQEVKIDVKPVAYEKKNAPSCDKMNPAVVETVDKDINSSLSTMNTLAELTDGEELPLKRRKTSDESRLDGRNGRRVEKRPPGGIDKVTTRKGMSIDLRDIPTPNVVPFHSSDAPSDEVVTDCSSDGLSGKEVPKSGRKATKCPADDSGNDASDDDAGRSDARQSRSRCSSKRGAGRTRAKQRGSSSSSSGVRNDTAKGLLPVKRRKLRRKRAPVDRPGRTGRGTVAITTNPTSTTNTCSISPPASKLKVSSADAQYVISEIVSSEEDVGQGTISPGQPVQKRLLEVVSVRNNRVLKSAKPVPRITRSSGTISTNIPQPAEPTAPVAVKSVMAAPVETPPVNAPKKGRGRPRKDGRPTNGEVTETTAAEAQVATGPKGKAKRGRSREESPKQDDVSNSTETLDPTASVKCGNCEQDVPQSSWNEHVSYHNGVAFRVGIDEMLDLHDLKTVSGMIARFMKTHRRVEVVCERCGAVKKSFLGMASHRSTCGLAKEQLEQSKIACEHCGRKMMAASLPVHQHQYCRVLKQQQEESKQAELDHSTAEMEAVQDGSMNASGRMKRKSVATAERKIKKLAHDLLDDSSELVVKVADPQVTNDTVTRCWLKHLQQSNAAVCQTEGCPFIGSTAVHIRSSQAGSRDCHPLFQCVKCSTLHAGENKMAAHLQQTHPEDTSALVQLRAAVSDLNDDRGNRDGGYVLSGDTSTEDSYSSSNVDPDDGYAVEKKPKPLKATKRGDGKTPAKKASAGKSSNSSGKDKEKESLDSSIASTANDDADVYKEMVAQESLEYRQEKSNFYLTTIKWTLDFRREHYAARSRLLFGNLPPDTDIRFLTASTCASYLPRSGRSMRFAQCNVKLYDNSHSPEAFKDQWQQLATFQGEAVGCESLLYCGGPVTSLDWLPLPDSAHDDVDQFLAVACKQTHDEYYNCEELASYRPRKCLIQIWNVGPIKKYGTSVRFQARRPQLSFAIACDFGPIWQVAFCPSGCYDEPSQGLDRIGLLAAAGSDGDVHLFTLDRNLLAGTGNNTAAGSLPPPPRIVKLRPVLRLSLSLTHPHTNQRTDDESGAASDFTGRSVVRISWSRDKGHQVLAAGYSNGVVAVWNLGANSPLLCGTKDGVRTLLPVHKVLHSSSSCITALDLHYGSGSRFLVVCNADRRMKVYDLHSGQYQPMEVGTMVARSRVTCIRWLLHFPVLVIAYDDVLCVERCAYTVHQPREIGLRLFGLISLGAEATDIGVNDWYSVNAITTNGGDVVCHKPMPFVCNMSNKKLAQVLTTTTTHKLNNVDDSTDLSSYDVFAREYGLLFSDTDKVPNAMNATSLQVKSWRRGQLNHYPAVRLNQLRWNPNYFSHTYYAIGYQAGFVRIRPLRTALL